MASSLTPHTKFYLTFCGKRITDSLSGPVDGFDTYEEAMDVVPDRASRFLNQVDDYQALPETFYSAGSAKLVDVKAALNSGIKPDITHVRTPLLNYTARGSEYGNVKYERANYARKTDSLKADFERLRAYLRAEVSHTMLTLDEMERHQANDPELKDDEGMRRACFAADTSPGNDKVGPSGLPHLCGAAASLNMALEQATAAGLLPIDPGQPWTKKE